MRSTRLPGLVPLVVALLVFGAPLPAAGDEPAPALAILVTRTLSDGTCLGRGDLVVCSLEAFLREGRVQNTGGDPPRLPYEAVSLSVVVIPQGDSLLVVEVFAQRERWKRDGDTTVVDQMLVFYWGPNQGQAVARRLRLDGPTLLGVDPLPRTTEDAQSVWNLLTRLFLGTQV